jgi:hypothetical protein
VNTGSRDPSTGENRLYGEYLIDAQVPNRPITSA